MEQYINIYNDLIVNYGPQHFENIKVEIQKLSEELIKK